MSIDDAPFISPELVTHLEDVFPHPTVMENDTFEAIRWKAAQASVVSYLRVIMEEQVGLSQLEN